MMKSVGADEVALALARGEVVAIPTETYYGLAAALRDDAIARVLALKGRDAARTLSVLITPAMLPSLVAEISPTAQALIAKHWPGPLTLALPARAGLPEALVQEGCVAVRVSPDATARAIVERFGAPVTATSANPSGQPPCRTAAEVQAYFPDLLIAGEGPTPGGAPSTLARVVGDRVTVLRPGPIVL
jgi:L-threonylcarbamoyladenylate synthase